MFPDRRDAAQSAFEGLAIMMTGRWTVAAPWKKPYPGLALAVVLASLLWAYWTTLAEAVQKWSHDPQYSHGYLVPAFAVALLWLRRAAFPTASIRPSWWGGLLLAAG